MKYAPWALWAMLPLTIVFRLNMSPSEPVGLYRLTHDSLKHGAYVILADPLKRIAGIPGDTVRTAPEGSYINGKLWPMSAPNADFPHCPYGVYTLKQRQLWVMGENPLSYDSRYFCAIPQSLIFSAARPVWTRP
jgi:type IV secretory pathway protease TraF